MRVVIMTALVLGEVVAGTAAAAICFALARGRTGVQRRWRLFAGAGLAGWALALVVLPDPGLLVLHVCLLLALLQAPYARLRSVPNSPLRDQIALVIDSVLISGSLLALLCTVLSERLMPVGRTAAYPIADLVLLTMVILLLLTRPGAPMARVPVWMGGLAVLSFGVADTFRLLGQPSHPLESVGYLIGPGFRRHGGHAGTGLAAPAAAVRAGDRDRDRHCDLHGTRQPALAVRGVPGLAGSGSGRGPADVHHRGQHGAARPGVGRATAAAPSGIP
jgi:hypothetical protein